ncbi:hypothetical protein BDQ17DRAFT_1326129 [Cyathus striatus]|nr:hypothetical protein BDQ17DRAFT_1326129 [Cyathus striatus]
MYTRKREHQNITFQEPVFDIVVQRGGQLWMMPPRRANAGRIYYPEGNLLVFTERMDVAGLKHIALKTAQALSIAHEQRMVHGNLSPSTIYVDENSVKLQDVGLFPLAHKYRDRIQQSPSHDYKANVELRDDSIGPSQLTDLHSWAKTIVALFTRRPFRALTSIGVPLTITKPQEVPEDIWKVIVQCLDEQLSIHVNMGQVVSQLRLLGIV